MNFSLNKSIVWNTIGITLNSFYSLVLTMFIVRIASDGIETAGLFSFIFYMSSILFAIGNFGGRIYQVSDHDHEFNVNEYYSFKIITSTVMLILALIFAVVNNYETYKVALLLVIVLYRVFESISDTLYGIMQINNNLESVGKSLSIKVLLSVLGFCIVFFLTKSILLSSFSFVIFFSFIFVLYDLRIVKKYTNINFILNKNILVLFKKTFAPFLFTFFILILLNITRYAVDRNLNNTAQGYYTILIMPASLISLFAQFIIQPLLRPLVSDYHNNGVRFFAKRIWRITLILLVIGSIIALFTYWFGILFLEILYGVSLSGFELPLSFVILAGIASGCATIISTALTIMRKMKIQVIVYGLNCIVAIILSFVFIYESVYQALYVYVLILLLLFISFLSTFWLSTSMEIKKGENT